MRKMRYPCGQIPRNQQEEDKSKSPSLFIFRFESKSEKYTKGYYYFIAENQTEAIKLASRFQHENNEEHKYLSVYSIFFDFKDIKCLPIEKGILKVSSDFR